MNFSAEYRWIFCAPETMHRFEPLPPPAILASAYYEEKKEEEEEHVVIVDLTNQGLPPTPPLILKDEYDIEIISREEFLANLSQNQGWSSTAINHGLHRNCKK